ncbi:MAG TPA: hypothetical protein VFN16_07100 [Saccharospirillum sp.]|nr:hypothetical protein [Saccharospirillum sp.]
MMVTVFLLAISLMLIGYTLTVVEAMRHSATWGLATLIPPLAVVFAVWRVRQQPVATALLILPLVFILAAMPYLSA